jgi:hypothetical protein
LTGKLTNKQLMEALSRKRMAWQDTISAAENKISAIDSITGRLSKSQDAKKLNEMTDEQRAWLMVKMVCIEDLRGQSVLSEALWL